ncbi:MAG: hypothetical protein ACFFBP_07025 [Promethearchaeota archaeon]
MKEYKLVKKLKQSGSSTFSTMIKSRESQLKLLSSEGWRLVGVDRNFFYLEREI